MNFRTKIDITESPLRLSHKSKILIIGSCFAESVGGLLLGNKFPVLVNPFGIVYNPASISAVLRRISEPNLFDESDVFEYQGLFHSSFHHTSFSSDSKAKSVSRINESLKDGFIYLQTANTLVVTFGTAYVFVDKQTDKVVANCHKLPASRFDRLRLSVDEIIEDWESLIMELRSNNSDLNILFTVSPIRHWKDGAHDNQLSKSTLLLAIEGLQRKLSKVFYFPSYELLLDDLRDYRFYAEDMVHPSPVAVNYIWECFKDSFFDSDTKQTIKEWSLLKRAIDHRPFNENSSDYRQFIRQSILKFDLFQEKYPYIDTQSEKLFLENKLP